MKKTNKKKPFVTKKDCTKIIVLATSVFIVLTIVLHEIMFFDSL